MRLALLLLLVGCGRPTPREAGQPGAAFPHPAGFLDTHGASALAEGAACGGCHGVSADQEVKGAASAAPACQSCHAYPHQGALSDGAVHGPLWLADPSACSACHGAGGDQAPGGVAVGQCTSCHHSFPHPPGFEAVEGHGAALLSRGGAASCQACHGEAGGQVEPACQSCHADYPHAAGWLDAHGAAARADLASCAARCHNPSLDDGLSRPRCASCHDLYPHPEGWAQAHAATAQQRGDGACEACHADLDARGPSLPVSCGAACHGEASP